MLYISDTFCTVAKIKRTSSKCFSAFWSSTNVTGFVKGVDQNTVQTTNSASHAEHDRESSSGKHISRARGFIMSRRNVVASHHSRHCDATLPHSRKFAKSNGVSDYFFASLNHCSRRNKAFLLKPDVLSG